MEQAQANTHGEALRGHAITCGETIRGILIGDVNIVKMSEKASLKTKMLDNRNV